MGPEKSIARLTSSTLALIRVEMAVSARRVVSTDTKYEGRSTRGWEHGFEQEPHRGKESPRMTKYE